MQPSTRAALAETPPQGIPMPAGMIANNEDDQLKNQIS